MSATVNVDNIRGINVVDNNNQQHQQHIQPSLNHHRSNSLGAIHSGAGTPMCATTPTLNSNSRSHASTRSDVVPAIVGGRRHLKGHVYTYSFCRTHCALHDYVISTAFHGRHGRGLLIIHVENIVVGKPEKRMLITGLHKVADIRCVTCDNVLGWKYERAYEESQVYKEGKYVLEKSLLFEERNAR